MILRDQLLLGKIPLVMVISSLFFSCGVNLFSFSLLAQHPGIIQNKEIREPQIVAPKAFDPMYQRAIGQRWIKSYGCWNRWNLESQITYARGLSSEKLALEVGLRLNRFQTLANRLRITRQTTIEDVFSRWDDEKIRQSQFAYLVRVDEWWAGTPQDPQWFMYSLQFEDVPADDKSRIVANVIGFSSVEVTDKVLADRHTTIDAQRAAEKPADLPKPVVPADPAPFPTIEPKAEAGKDPK